MRPLESHSPGRIELFQEMLNEGADGIHPAIIGMQPETVLTSRFIDLHLELPDVDLFCQTWREVRRRFSFTGLPGLVVNVEGVFLSLLTGQVQDQTESGVVVGHVDFGVLG